MGILDEIDEEFATAETHETDTEEGKNGTSEGEELEGSDDEKEEGEEKPEGDEEETDEKKETEKGEQKPKNGVQKRIDTLVKKNYELQRKLEEATRQEQQPKRKMPEPPDPKNFPSLRELEIARAKYETTVEHVNQQIADDEARAHEDVMRTVSSKIQAEKDKYDDFAEVIENVSDIAIHDDVLSSLVINDPNGVDTLYWLGQHRSRAESISRLKPAEQALALGRISANIKAQRTGKQVSGAPKPPAKVGGKGGGAAPVTDPAKMSTEQYVAYMNKRKK